MLTGKARDPDKLDGIDSFVVLTPYDTLTFPAHQNIIQPGSFGIKYDIPLCTNSSSLIRVGTILILSYYLLGTLCLPSGNFSFGVDLPEMYRHCKAHEDKDMTPLDFVTDHLMDIDGMFDKHCNGDRQKPHSRSPIQHHPIQIVISFEPFTSQSFRSVSILEKQPLSDELLYKSGFCHKIFHPPVS